MFCNAAEDSYKPVKMQSTEYTERKKGSTTMGNRAVITTRENFNNDGVGVYLHWNGGKDSVKAFLAYCKIKGYRSPDTDCYGWARLAQVIGNFFGGELSVGIDKVSRLDCDNWDNGTYIIEGWNIVGREYQRNADSDEYDLIDFINDIDKSMPASEQLGSEEIYDRLMSNVLIEKEFSDK